MRGVERYRRADDALSLSRAFFASAEAAELRRQTNLEDGTANAVLPRRRRLLPTRANPPRGGDAKPRVRSAVT